LQLNFQGSGKARHRHPADRMVLSAGRIEDFHVGTDTEILD
jgi:hypothetical protein